MKLFVAIVREKGSKDYQKLSYLYSSKKSFAEDLRANGYKVRNIYTHEEYETLCNQKD